MKLYEFCEKFIAHNTVVYLVQEIIKKNEEGVKQHEYNKIWQGMDWQIVQGAGDEDYFKAHPDVEKCPFKNYNVAKVIGNIFNAFPDTADNITLVIDFDYKNYHGSFDYSENDKCWYGKIEGITDLVTYEAETQAELKKSFCEAVDDYIEFCKEVKEGKEKNAMTMDEIWNALQDGDDTKVAAGLVIGDLIARIISKRHEQRMSQADLARKMGVSVSRIRRMENLNAMPKIDIVIQAMLVLGIGITTPTMMTPELRGALTKACVKFTGDASDDTEDCNFISPDTERKVIRERREEI